MTSFHLNVTSVDEHRRFWVDTLGAVDCLMAGTNAARFPNLQVLFRRQRPTGGSKGTTTNHVAFQVPDLRAMVEKLRSAGYPIVTRDETKIPEKDGMAFVADQNQSIAFVMAPDGMKVEFVGVEDASEPILLHHIHFFTPDVIAMRGWYAKTLHATPGRRGSFETADLPGVNLTFVATADPVIGTSGRVLDHVAFDVPNVETFCAELEASGVTVERPLAAPVGSAIARIFITDPWGTAIELTEELPGEPGPV